MDERRLRSYLAVIDEGGITRAAARLHVAQPSLSQTLRSLEAELGVELFHRAGRGVRPSAAGEALVGPARRVLRAIDEARNAVAGVVELRTGTLEIAALATLAVDPMAVLIGRFRERYPGVEVRVEEPDSAGGVSALVQSGTCELGAAHLPLSRSDPVGRAGQTPATSRAAGGAGLVTHHLGEQELLFVFPPGTSLPGRSPLAPAALAEIPLVVSPPGTSTRILLEQALNAVGVTPRIAVQTAAREAIVPLVLASAGAALLPAPLAREAERRGAVIRAARPPITRPIGLIHREGPLSPAAHAFLALARKG
jgi:DNA-binding transcriptional LysR family regulator